MEMLRYGRYGEVAVIAVSGGLSQVRTTKDEEFWVKTASLKAGRPVRQGGDHSGKEHVHVDSLLGLEEFLEKVISDPQTAIYISCCSAREEVERYDIENYTGKSFDSDWFTPIYARHSASYQLRFCDRFQPLLPMSVKFYRLHKRKLLTITSKLLVMELLKRGLLPQKAKSHDKG